MSESREEHQKKRVKANLTLCRYPIIKQCIEARGWEIVSNVKDPAKLAKCNLHWIDVAEISEEFNKVRPFCKINHFPGMSNIARKTRMARALERMNKIFPKEYDFYPRTWVLPSEFSDFQSQFNSEGYSRHPMIIKPDAGCQGRGVFLTKHLEKVSKTDCQVAQKYIKKPLLINGKKFDLRVYVLITSCDPLKVYFFKDGLVRLCAEDYISPTNENLEKRCMHLTNYAVNKLSENFQKNVSSNADGDGSKRSLRWFMSWIASENGQDIADRLWSKICDLSLKIIIAGQPNLAQEYHSTFAKYNLNSKNKNQETHANENLSNSCSFALLGLDVLIDSKLKPWLIEVNHLPSFRCDAPIDQDIKERLITQTLDLLNLHGQDEKKYGDTQAKLSRMRLYGKKDEEESRGTESRGTESRETESRETESRGTNDNNEGHSFSEENLASNSEYKRSSVSDALKEFYMKINPEKIGDIDAIVTKYDGKYNDLVKNMNIKYGKDAFRLPENVGEEIVPETQSDDEEETPLKDYIRLYPVPHGETQFADYDALLRASSQQMHERQVRFQAPLQQRRGETMVSDILPPLTGLRKPDLGRNGFGAATRVYDNVEKKTLAMPGPQQTAAAFRLMKGYSSSHNSSIGPSPPTLVHPQQPPVRIDSISYGVKYRQRLEDRKMKPTIALSRVSFTNVDLPF